VKLENVKQIAQNTAVGVDDTRAKHQSLLKELQEERAAALARISRRLERLIDQLQTTREQIAHSNDEDRERNVTAYRELREQAVKYRWYLEVQREAIGLRQHQRLDEFYRIPPAEP
jgi:CRP-like cAMP-binding protein